LKIPDAVARPLVAAETSGQTQLHSGVDAQALCRPSGYVADRTNLTHSGISIGLLRRLTRGEAQTDHQLEIWTLNSAEAVPIDLG